MESGWDFVVLELFVTPLELSLCWWSFYWYLFYSLIPGYYPLILAFRSFPCWICRACLFTCSVSLCIMLHCSALNKTDQCSYSSLLLLWVRSFVIVCLYSKLYRLWLVCGKDLLWCFISINPAISSFISGYMIPFRRICRGEKTHFENLFPLLIRDLGCT